MLAFIRKARKPERYVREAQRFEPMRANLNRALVFAGFAVDATETLGAVAAARTLPEAARRAQELRDDLVARGVHADILVFCCAEFGGGQIISMLCLK